MLGPFLREILGGELCCRNHAHSEVVWEASASQIPYLSPVCES